MNYLNVHFVLVVPMYILSRYSEFNIRMCAYSKRRCYMYVFAKEILKCFVAKSVCATLFYKACIIRKLEETSTVGNKKFCIFLIQDKTYFF